MDGSLSEDKKLKAMLVNAGVLIPLKKYADADADDNHDAVGDNNDNDDHDNGDKDNSDTQVQQLLLGSNWPKGCGSHWGKDFSLLG